MSLSDGRLPSSQAFDHLVYLRVFEGCNLHCQHCFIPSNPKRMTMEQIENVPNLLSGRVAPGSTVLIQWHGGEPTLMGPKFIRAGIDALSCNGIDIRWRHGIQTNLMTFDETWASLYKDHFGGEVGVSWDPKIRLLNKHALDSSDAFNAKFDQKLAELIAHGLTPYVVVTAAGSLFKAFPNPFDFFKHWTDRGVRHVHLERITETGYARDNWDRVGLTNAEYSEKMSRWLKAYQAFLRASPDTTRLHLSPFENLADSVASLEAEAARSHGCWSGTCDTRYHTIDAQGYKFGCTALTSEQGNKRSNARLDLGSDLTKQRELRTFDCRKCQFKPICSSGCLALSFDDGSGECSGGFKLFDTAHRIAFPSSIHDVPRNAPLVNTK
jgi:radical SAM protein with 4Fe4S-binding SPASM domain